MPESQFQIIFANVKQLCQKLATYQISIEDVTTKLQHTCREVENSIKCFVPDSRYFEIIRTHQILEGNLEAIIENISLHRSYLKNICLSEETNYTEIWKDDTQDTEINRFLNWNDDNPELFPSTNFDYDDQLRSDVDTSITQPEHQVKFGSYEFNSNMGSHFQEYISNNDSLSVQKRGPYKRYGKKDKLLFIELARSGKDIREIAREKKIPLKNLKRWVEHGPDRKKGGGRKTLDPIMEKEVYQWCISEAQRQLKPVPRSQIKKKAIELTRHRTSFKGSKGWLDKFIKRYDLQNTLRKEIEKRKLNLKANETDIF